MDGAVIFKLDWFIITSEWPLIGMQAEVMHYADPDV